MAVAVGVGCPAHGGVLLFVGQQAGELAADGLLIGAHKLERAGSHALGALGGVAHHEHGLAQGGRLLLDAARVGEDEVGGGHEVMEVQHLQRVDDPQAVEAVELLVRGLTHERVHMDGVDRLGVGVLLHDSADGAEHPVHGLTEVLSAVRRHEDEAGARGPLELRMRVALPHRGRESVDTGVAGDPYAGGVLALGEQVRPGGLRGREVPTRHHVHRLAVELLGPGAVEVVRTQARLDVAHRYLEVEGRERGGEARGGVAVHEHAVGALRLENRLEPLQHARGHVEQRLAGPHDGEVVVRDHAEDAQHLVEHLAVLPGDGDHGLELVGTRLEYVHERAHLDGLRTGAEDQHNFPHEIPPDYLYII